MIAQGFGFTRDFLKERNNSAYFRLKKIPCEFKEQARARHPGEKCGLEKAAVDQIQHGVASAFADCRQDEENLEPDTHDAGDKRQGIATEG
jgi:hypothetical protein